MPLNLDLSLQVVVLVPKYGFSVPVMVHTEYYLITYSMIEQFANKFKFHAYLSSKKTFLTTQTFDRHVAPILQVTTGQIFCQAKKEKKIANISMHSFLSCAKKLSKSNTELRVYMTSYKLPMDKHSVKQKI